LLQVHGAKSLPESNLARAIHFRFERTSEQDPKCPIRLLVDVAGDFNNMIHFYKNLVMAGGFLYVMTYGAGAMSIDGVDEA
jgi:hypothetical protein